jgi:AraC-like DNA-binding protein
MPACVPRRRASLARGGGVETSHLTRRRELKVWDAHKLNAPGKFLVSAPEHDIPRLARAYLVTDEMVAETAARHSRIPRELDQVSRDAMLNAPAPEYAPQYGNPGNPGPAPEEALWLVLNSAPEEGWEIGQLISRTGMTRTTLYRHLRDLVSRAYQVSRGRWRARPAEGGYGE